MKNLYLSLFNHIKQIENCDVKSLQSGLEWAEHQINSL